MTFVLGGLVVPFAEAAEQANPKVLFSVGGFKSKVGEWKPPKPQSLNVIDREMISFIQISIPISIPN